MSDLKWNPADFKTFVDKNGISIVLSALPPILYSKNDREPESFYSLIGFFLSIGLTLIYIAISALLASIIFNLIFFAIIIVIGVFLSVAFLFNYLKTNIRIKPIECWIEIFRGPEVDNFRYYCFVYYPIYSGKCHPNEAKNIVYKLYQEELYGTTIDITQIEVYLKIYETNNGEFNHLGYYFQYAEGKPFNTEDLPKNAWKFFDHKHAEEENYLATGNWAHFYEWRFDLALDYDKLNSYAPWIVQNWNVRNIKPLTLDFKRKMDWEKRNLINNPSLTPWIENYQKKEMSYNPLLEELKVVEKAFIKIMGPEKEIEKLKDIEDKLFEFKAFFRDLDS